LRSPKESFVLSEEISPSEIRETIDDDDEDEKVKQNPLFEEA